MANISDLESETPYNQNYVVLSYVGPEANQKCNDHAVMIRGVFRNQEQAVAFAKECSSKCALLDVFVAEMGKFLVLPPKIEIKDTVYHDDRLNELMQGYVENQERAKQNYEQYKNEMLEKAKQENEKVVKRNNLIETSDIKTEEESQTAETSTSQE
mgnify:CR=1 FL=1